MTGRVSDGEGSPVVIRCTSVCTARVHATGFYTGGRLKKEWKQMAKRFETIAQLESNMVYRGERIEEVPVHSTENVPEVFRTIRVRILELDEERNVKNGFSSARCLAWLPLTQAKAKAGPVGTLEKNFFFWLSIRKLKNWKTASWESFMDLPVRSLPGGCFWKLEKKS